MKASKYYWKHVCRSAKKTSEETDSARSFRIETSLKLQKGNIYMKKLLSLIVLLLLGCQIVNAYQVPLPGSSQCDTQCNYLGTNCSTTCRNF